jgi:4-amino-4-deoxy-L-arabinose transferase-like glycosyltransferase
MNPKGPFVERLAARPRSPVKGLGSSAHSLGRALVRPQHSGIAILLCGWLLLVLVANPFGEFPLNDDWSYSQAVKSLVDHGQLAFTDFTSMTLVAQVLWGAVFSLPFGFSFLALRLSTVVLGAVGVAVTYALLRELGVGRRLSLLGAAVLGLNPLYFSLSLSFMTDVPFTVAALLSILFFTRSFRTDALVDVLLGFAFAVVVVLIRQPGIVVPIAYAIAFLVKWGWTRRTLTRAIIPAGAVLAVVMLYPFVIKATVGLPANFIGAQGLAAGIRTSAADDLLSVPRAILDRLWLQLIYLGLFVFPLAPLAATSFSQRLRSRSSRRQVIALCALLAAIGAILLARDALMPLSGNVLFDLGLGPLLLRDTYLLGLPHFPSASPVFWAVVTAAAALGAATLSACVWSAGRTALAARLEGSGQRDVRLMFVLLVGLVYVAGVAVSTASPQYSFFDRYVVFLLVPAIAVLAKAAPASNRGAAPALATAIVLVGLYSVFSVTQTHDYLAWNRARWQALGDLTRQGVPPTKIDGGFEFNAWYGYDSAAPPETAGGTWRTQGDEYVVTLGSLPSYVEVRRYPFRRWLPFRSDAITVLRPNR